MKKAEEWLERTYSKSYWADMTCPSAASKQAVATSVQQAGTGGFLYIWSDQRSGGAASRRAQTLAVERAKLCQTDELQWHLLLRTAQYSKGQAFRNGHAPCEDRLARQS